MEDVLNIKMKKLLMLALIVVVSVISLMVGMNINNNEGSSIYEGCWHDVQEQHFGENGKVDATVDKADWVCVNVQGMSFDRAVEVCQHEVGHEIFAEICEKNMTKCFEVVE